jgi:DNA-binding MarR family transcriptional regulator
MTIFSGPQVRKLEEKLASWPTISDRSPMPKSQIVAVNLDAVPDALLRVMSLFVRRARAENSHALNLTQAQALGRLAEAGPMTIADLARAERLRPQTVGAIVATLEEAGFVERRPHPTDGRQALLSLTRQGLDMRRANASAQRQWLQSEISQMAAKDQALLTRAVSILEKLASS